MKGIIVYGSKYGASRDYAIKLKNILGYELLDYRKMSEMDFSCYDVLIYCGGIYATGIRGLGVLKKHLSELSTKPVVVFAVGASPYDEEALLALRKRNFSESMKDTPLFYGRGTWDMSSMSVVDRLLCTLLIKRLKKKAPLNRSPWERELVSLSLSKANWISASYLGPLLEYIGDTIHQQGLHKEKLAQKNG